jgi:hypothetical protein
MCKILDSAHHFFVIQLTITIYFFLISFIYLNHLSGIYYFGLPATCPDMPVTTRSMMKHGLQPPPGSIGLLTCLTCCTDGAIDTSSSTTLQPLSALVSQVHELIDQCELSSSSSESDDSSSMSSNDLFELSKVENFEIFTNASAEPTCYNSNSCHSFEMDPDCDNNKIASVKMDNGQTNQDDIMNMLSLISPKMMDTIQDLQNQLTQNELKFTLELQRISAENETFRQNILTSIHAPPLAVNNMVAQVPTTIASSSTTPSPSPLSTRQSNTPLDFQNQMMMMLTETFTKLTTVMTDTKTSETKADWLKFSGDTRKFRHWYLAIVAQILLAPWKEFFNSSSNTLVKSTQNISLNEKLYAKLLLCIDGQVFQDMVSKKHLRGNGQLLLHESSQTYRPSHVPEVTAAKTVEFWSTMKRQSNESIDTYYNRFQALLDDLEEASEPIPVCSAVRQFIFTLGPDFAPIQHNFRIVLLPDE